MECYRISGGIFKLCKMKNNIELMASAITAGYNIHNKKSAYTVAISGIDASGKGFISDHLKTMLEQKGYRVALINIDPWQNPMAVRLDKKYPAINFYRNVIRWEAFFLNLLFPFQKNKKLELQTIGIRTNADLFYSLKYEFNNIDIILVEGIFLLKKDYLSYYNLKIWIDCSFETGLQRAIARNTEQLDKASLIYDYTTFYYPAQRHHFEKDQPVENADLVIDNN